MDILIKDDDLFDLLDELKEIDEELESLEREDVEMEASKRRYEEIIKKHKDN